MSALPAERLTTFEDSFTLLYLWRRWLSAQFSPNTVRVYTHAVTRLYTEQVQGPVHTVNEDHVAAFLDNLGDKFPSKGHYLIGVRSFMRWAVRRGVLDHDPTAELKIRKSGRRPSEALSEEEIIRVLVAAAWRHPKRAWTLLLYFCLGARRSELWKARPEDVGDGFIRLRHTKGRRPRNVELNSLALLAIEELRPWAAKGSLLPGVTEQTITEWATEAAQDAGLREKVRGRSLHIYRASFATHLLRNGAPVQVVRDLLGHRDLATTSIYAVSDEGDRREAVDSLLPGLSVRG